MMQRITSALVLLPLVLGAAYVGGPAFAAVVGVAALIAGYELFRMARSLGHRPSYVAGLGVIAALILDAYRPNMGLGRWALIFAAGGYLTWQVFHKEGRGFIYDWSIVLAGAVYVGGLAGHMVLLRNLPRGLDWLLFTFLVTWTCDSAAFLVGSLSGRHPFFAHVSPKKTVEGAIGGFVVGIALGTLVGQYMGMALWQAFALSTLLVLGSTFGDLSESVLKRQVGVKDSGSLIPGHGGMLDRIDSLLFAGAITYYFVIWVLS